MSLVAVRPPPPDYDVGGYVVCASSDSAHHQQQLRLAKTQQHSTTIEIDQNTERRTFNRGDAITGRVIFTPGSDVAFDRVLVDLQATESIFRGEVVPEPQRVRSFSIARFKVQEEAYPCDKIFKKGWQYMFTFTLVIPHMLQEDYCDARLPLHLQLPPSVGSPIPSGKNNKDALEAAAKEALSRGVSITYRVRARVTKQIEGTTVPLISQKLHYLNVMPSYPIVQFEPKVYSSSTLLKQGVLKRNTQCELELSTANVVAFYINQGHSLRTVFDIAYRVPCSLNARPPLLSKLAYRLTAITTSANSARAYYPSPDDLYVRTIKEKFDTQSSNIRQQPHWETRTVNGQIELHARLELVLNLPKDHRDNIVPTYFTCFSSRQYELSAVLSIQNSSPAYLTVPVVISRDRCRHLLGLTHDESEEDDILDPVPQYEYYGREVEIKLEYGRDYRNHD